MDNMIQTGFLCGMAAACFLVVLLKKLVYKGSLFKCRYDERQQLVRGRGFQYGFFGWIFFTAGYIVLDTGFGKRYLDTSMALFLGLMIGAVIYASYAIWHEGYFSLNIYPKRFMGVMTAVTVLNIICSVHFIFEGELCRDGMLTFFGGSNLVCAAASLTVLFVLAAKYGYDHRKAE